MSKRQNKQCFKNNIERMSKRKRMYVLIVEITILINKKIRLTILCKIQAERKYNAIVNLKYKNDLLTKCKPKIFLWGHMPDSCWNRISRASNLVGAQHFPLCIRIFSRRPRCQPASHWIIVRTKRVLHCKWQFVRVLWGFRYPSLSLSLFALLYFSFCLSLYPSPRSSMRATTTVSYPPPPPTSTGTGNISGTALGSWHCTFREKRKIAGWYDRRHWNCILLSRFCM